MSFYRVIILLTLVMALSQNVFGDDTDQKNIVDQAKDINAEIKAKQAATEANINSEIGQNQTEEEPLPLNDPFAGDAPAGATVVATSSDEVMSEMQVLQKYKLVGILEAQNRKYVTLVTEGAEYLSLELYEEITDKLKLVDINIREIAFQKEEDGKYIIMNFKNELKARDEL